MARKRIFESLPRETQLINLFRYLSEAVQEWNPKDYRTDIYGCANQFGGHRIKRSDFDLIKKMTIEGFVNHIIKLKTEKITQKGIKKANLKWVNPKTTK
jgi:hypothetical protein